jgi:hypothetical protein
MNSQLVLEGHSSPLLWATDHSDEVQLANIHVRPILLTAVSDDGLDLIEVDVRKWFEKTTRTSIDHFKTFSNTWFRCESSDSNISVYKELLRTCDSETSLFLHRVSSRKIGWSCSIEAKAMLSWIVQKKPDLVVFIDPLMGLSY